MIQVNSIGQNNSKPYQNVKNKKPLAYCSGLWTVEETRVPEENTGTGGKLHSGMARLEWNLQPSYFEATNDATPTKCKYISPQMICQIHITRKDIVTPRNGAHRWMEARRWDCITS